MIQEVEHSLRLVPDDAERNYALALIHVMRGKFNDAIRSLSRGGG
jgi:thioredoxin-like negative regulator of GroEL